ncbi:MAG: hypothetical protein E4H14_12715 [Candidatus Thorarchaeota archaeon]|nr:MAG: hypothetical protein E4H14_12715 [Candidatus Thorarchaeota archaeon]
MGAVRKNKKLSRLIPKNHFCSFPLFRERPLINWTYTDAVLFTAYDVYRSTDFWLDQIINSGKTLKEGLIELGFPKGNSLVADTGVFEMEAKKAGISLSLGIEVDIELSNAQIFEAYELSGADYFVAPDEIVLPQDKKEDIVTKTTNIKENLLDLLEVVPTSKVIAVIQGHTEETISNLFDFYRGQGISCFAMGGVIPLYHHSKDLLDDVLRYVRDITKEHWLHIFGLPRMSLLQYYLHDIGVDSVDTSALLYMTARRRYLIGSKGEQVRKAVFKDCNCEGCSNLEPMPSPRSPDFFVNLYIHNILEAVKLAEKPFVFSSRQFESDTKEKIDSDTKHEESKLETPIHDEVKAMDKLQPWMTAKESLEIRMREKEDENHSNFEDTKDS